MILSSFVHSFNIKYVYARDIHTRRPSQLHVVSRPSLLDRLKTRCQRLQVEALVDTITGSCFGGTGSASPEKEGHGAARIVRYCEMRCFCDVLKLG